MSRTRSEKTHVEINGVRQGMVIRSTDETNPVLLFVHGGPGMPEYFLTQDYPTGLEHDFNVVWWDQRGAGLSYGPRIPASTMIVEQFVVDTIGVTEYLRHRFSREKIYLMGHSWGSLLGIQAAERAPDLYHAYIGVAQIAHQAKSEQLAYDYLLEEYLRRGDSRMVRKLRASPVTGEIPLPASYMAIRDKAMHQLGVGTTRDMTSVFAGIFLPSWRFDDYTVKEKLNLWRGRLFSRRFGLWDQMSATDLTKQVTRLEIPAFFLHGLHDWTVSYTLTKSYIERLDAPAKGFYTFENSAHSPVFEEPNRTRRILRQDILAGTPLLADSAPTRDDL